MGRIACFNESHAGSPHPQTARRRLGARAGGCLRQVLPMVGALALGMGGYRLALSTILRGTAFAALVSARPFLGSWVMVAAAALPTIVLMRCLRRRWSYCAEVTVAMIAPLAQFSLLVLCNGMPAAALPWIFGPVMAIAMVAYSLVCPADQPD